LKPRAHMAASGQRDVYDSKKLAYENLYVSRKNRNREPCLRIKLAPDH
jgi:hypothetical protein